MGMRRRMPRTSRLRYYLVVPTGARWLCIKLYGLVRRGCGKKKF